MQMYYVSVVVVFWVFLTGYRYTLNICLYFSKLEIIHTYLHVDTLSARPTSVSQLYMQLVTVIA